MSASQTQTVIMGRQELARLIESAAKLLAADSKGFLEIVASTKEGERTHLNLVSFSSGPLAGAEFPIC